MDPEYVSYYNEEVIPMIAEKYDFNYKDALKDFWHSEIYKMWLNPEMAIQEFSALAIFDMWEAEKVTGNLRNSSQLRKLWPKRIFFYVFYNFKFF